MNNQVSRKDFLMKCFGLAGVFIGGSALLSSCNSGTDAKPADAAGGETPKSMLGGEPPATTTGGACGDLSGVAPEELKKREAVQYANVSADPAKHCKLCQLYTVPAAGQTCGGCTLFKGPVEPEGSCISFVAKPA
jgi:hypothetical protein